MQAQSVIVLELNELSPRLMAKFIASGDLPNFERLRSQSTVMITDPEEPQSKLNPWIQWVTAHTGVPRDEHGIEKLGEAERLRFTTMSEVVGDAGRSVWICGSMNVPARSVPRGAYLPDPWNPQGRARPDALTAFAEFVRANVQEHTNERTRMSPTLAANAAGFMMRHGLSAATTRAAIRQLVDERRGRTGRWARACVLDRLQWDVFRWYVRKEQPALSTFFSNSTAHFQHMYWRNFEPDRFTHPPTSEEQSRFGEAVRLGYQRMDGLVGEALDLADEQNACLMFCTGLSQQPYVDADEVGGKFTYRPHDFDAVLDAVGVKHHGKVSPVMAGEFHVFFDTAADAEEAAEQFRNAFVGDQAAFGVRVVDNDLFTGCRISEDLPAGTQLRTANGSHRLFHELFYRFETSKSGYHHPDGMWWVRTGQHHVVDQPVPLRAVAPTVLALLGLEPPETMRADPVDLGAAPV